MAGPRKVSRKDAKTQRVRIYFRRFRIAIWLLLLGLLASVIYLNQHGLPGFLKRPLLRQLEARGIDLQFSRLRMRWYEGLVFEEVRFGRTGGELSPSLTAEEAKVLLDWRMLLRGQMHVDALVIRQGTLVMPVPDDSRPGRQLIVTNIQTQLRLLPQDQWMLDQFRAGFANADLNVFASVRNASAARNWPFLKSGTEPGTGERTRERLKSAADLLERITFDVPPRLAIDISGDARDLRSFKVQIEAHAPRAKTPWGDISAGHLKARLQTPEEGGELSAKLDLNAKTGNTRWGSVKDFALAMELLQRSPVMQLVEGKLAISAAAATTPWGMGTNVHAKADWVHSFTNPVPLWASGEARSAMVKTKWAQAESAQIRISASATNQLAASPTTERRSPGRLHVSTSASTNQLTASPSPEWGWWTNLAPFHLEWTCIAEKVENERLTVDHAELSGFWAAPTLEVQAVNVKLYGGSLAARGAVDVETRHISAAAALDFDIHKAEGVLTEGGRRWISQYTWNAPPKVSAYAKATLPSWTNTQPDWRGEVLPTLWLSGQFSAENGGGYRGLQASSASSSFAYSNRTWHLPDLLLLRPEGRMEAEHIASDRTRQYYWKIHSTLDPAIVRPLLKTNQTRIFELLELTQAPEINAEVWGRFHDYDALGARAFVKATNFSFRGQTATRVEAEILYSNKVIRVLRPKLEREAERAAADAVTVDFNARQVYLTNAVGNADPLVIARAIGPKVGRTMEAYLFEKPPWTRVSGVIPMRGQFGADLRFEVDGGPFHWWKFHMPRIAGQVHWKDYQLSLSGIDADFYRGRAQGNAVFDLSDIPGTEFMFSISATNVLLQSLLADMLTAATNKSEGWVEGTVIVTAANSDDWRSVQGHGQMRFHDGMLWDIPLFGVLSPVLDGMLPGLGSSRATDGTCTYVITNGVVRTSDLDLRTTTMRLQYRGDADMADEYKLKAKVEAELLRDMWLVGPIVSTVLWPVTKLFEIKMSGTLGEPQIEPLNVIPKLMLLPFYPFKVLKGIGSDHKNDPSP